MERTPNQIKHDVSGSIYKRTLATVIEAEGRNFKLDTKVKIGFIFANGFHSKVKKLGGYWHILGDKKPLLNKYDNICIGVKVEGYFHKYSKNLFRDMQGNYFTREENYAIKDKDFDTWRYLPPIIDKTANIFDTDCEIKDKKSQRHKNDYDPTVYLD